MLEPTKSYYAFPDGSGGAEKLVSAITGYGYILRKHEVSELLLAVVNWDYEVSWWRELAAWLQHRQGVGMAQHGALLALFALLRDRWHASPRDDAALAAIKEAFSVLIPAPYGVFELKESELLWRTLTLYGNIVDAEYSNLLRKAANCCESPYRDAPPGRELKALEVWVLTRRYINENQLKAWKALFTHLRRVWEARLEDDGRSKALAMITEALRVLEVVFTTEMETA